MLDSKRGEFCCGGYIIQFAKLYGLKTINIVRRQEVVQKLLDQGGDVVLLDGPHLAQELQALANDYSIKLAIDAVGGEITIPMTRACNQVALW